MATDSSPGEGSDSAHALGFVEQEGHVARRVGQERLPEGLSLRVSLHDEFDVL